MSVWLQIKVNMTQTLHLLTSCEKKVRRTTCVELLFANSFSFSEMITWKKHDFPILVKLMSYHNVRYTTHRSCNWTDIIRSWVMAAGYKQPGILHIIFVTNIAYKICHCFVPHARDVTTYCWGNFTNCACTCEASTFYSTRFLTLTWFMIEYHVNKGIPFLLFKCVQPSKYL